MHMQHRWLALSLHSHTACTAYGHTVLSERYSEVLLQVICSGSYILIEPLCTSILMGKHNVQTLSAVSTQLGYSLVSCLVLHVVRSVHVCMCTHYSLSMITRSTCARPALTCLQFVSCDNYYKMASKYGHVFQCF